MRAHGPSRARLETADLALVSGALVVGVWLGGPGRLDHVVAVVVVCAGVLGAVAGGSRSRMAVVVVAAGVCGAVLGGRAWEATAPDRLGPFNGWATAVDDASPIGRGHRVTIDIEGERYDMWGYGPASGRISRVESGDRVQLEGQRRALTGEAAHRAAVRHVVGRFDADVIGDVLDGSPAARAANRLRRLLRSTAEATMEAETAALFSGLVVGDDSRQGREIVADFRSSGLSHLTAVSGQNLTYLLAFLGPALGRLRPVSRWAATCAAILWFMSLTRFEPSIIRAGVMALLGATAFARGSELGAPRALAGAVGLLVVVDPLLVWSVGFWLSVSATAGVVIGGPRLAAVIPGPAWLGTSLGITLGAQVGVALPSLAVFGRLPLVALAANPAAVPVAGLVMVVGLPSVVAASLAPGRLAGPLMWPVEIGTRWVAEVARVAAAIEPGPPWSTIGWIVVVGLVGTRLARTRVQG